MVERRFRWLCISSAFAAAVVFVPPATAAVGPPSSGCEISPIPERTVESLRFHCDQAQIDGLYQSLAAGPMPHYGAKARGYWRWYPDARGLDEPGNRLMNLLVWQGKTFYTHETGGYMMNRVVADREGFRSAVYFADGWLDGRKAIIVDYGAAGDYPADAIFRDEIRMVQPGVYLGFGWRNREHPPWTNERFERITFVLDFVHPDLTTSDCPHCVMAR
ncbi:MAG: hypothetical protein AB1679_10140 [Actinomycetota bacterium]|jgi:hypothetical protein